MHGGGDLATMRASRVGSGVIMSKWAQYTKFVVVAACLAWAMAGTSGCSSPASTSSGGLPDAKNGVDGLVGGADDVTATKDGTGNDSSFTCTDGEQNCFNDTTATICVNGGWQVKEKCQNADTCVAGNCVTPADCTPNASLGCDAFTAEIHCAADGKSTFKVPCQGAQLCVNGACATTSCTPYSPQCVVGSQNKIHTCLPDGSAFGPEEDCKTGAYCVAGKCVSKCETNLKFASNVGCEYWTVDLDNDTDTNPATGSQAAMVPHSVVVTNPGIYFAEVTFTLEATCADGSACSPGANTCNNKPKTVCDKAGADYDLVFADNKVPAGGSKEFKMPVMNVSGSGVFRKAVHIKSTQPIVAYQFNPYNSEGAASNDGSLLLPQNVLGKTYYAMVPAQSRPALMGLTSPNNAFVTVVATLPGATTVKVTPTADMIANPKAGVPATGTTMKKGQTYEFQILQYDVLNVEAAPTSDIVPPNTGPQALKNMTGTKIEADKPVAVFSGHQVAGVEDDFRFGMSSGSESSFDTCCTEHMEEQLMPLEAWGNEAFCVKSKPRGTEVDEFVVVGGEAGVKLTTVPPIKGLDGVTIGAGERARGQTDESFMLKATGKIQVMQLLVSAGQVEAKSNGTSATLGDASMAIIPPKKQYRTDYVIQTADGYNQNYVSIVRPAGLDVTLDGNPVPAGFQPFGDGTWEYAYVNVQKGTHTLEAKDAFGLMVYGYGGVTAYSYPGGMLVQ